MKWGPFFTLLFAIIILIILSILLAIFLESLIGLNATSIGGNSTAPINPWSLVTTFLNSQPFRVWIPLLFISFLLLIVFSHLINDDGSYEPYHDSHIESEEENEEEEEEPIAQITPTGEL